MTNKQNSQKYMGNANLKAAGVTINFSEKQIEEYVRCSQDPVYFIKNYVKIISLDKGTIPFSLYDFQEDMIETVHRNRFVIAKCPRQSGKCVHKDVKIRIRNKITGQIKEISIEEFYNSIQQS